MISTQWIRIICKSTDDVIRALTELIRINNKHLTVGFPKSVRNPFLQINLSTHTTSDKKNCGVIKRVKSRRERFFVPFFLDKQIIRVCVSVRERRTRKRQNFLLINMVLLAALFMRGDRLWIKGIHYFLAVDSCETEWRKRKRKNSAGNKTQQIGRVVTGIDIVTAKRKKFNFCLFTSKNTWNKSWAASLHIKLFAYPRHGINKFCEPNQIELFFFLLLLFLFVV